MSKTHYETLGIEQNATETDIRRAYLSLASKVHPDKNPHPEAKQQFQELSAAYEVLSDLEKRRDYDYRLKNNLPYAYSKNHSESYYDEIFTAARELTNPKEEKRETKTRILKLFGAFDSMTKEQQLAVLKKNKTLLSDIYRYSEPDEFQKVIRFYPISELREALKTDTFLLCQLDNLNPDKFRALFDQFLPTERWNILHESYQGKVLKTLIEIHRHNDVLTKMLFSPQIYFDELKQQITALDVSTEINAQKLANALRALSADLAQDIAKLEKNKELPEVIQYSNAMTTLRETILMVRLIQTESPKNALNAINHYKEQCASKTSVFSHIVDIVIFAAMGLVVGALIGMIISLSMGAGVILPIIIGSVVGTFWGGVIAQENGASDMLNKHGLFQTKMELHKNYVVQAASEFRNNEVQI